MKNAFLFIILMSIICNSKAQTHTAETLINKSKSFYRSNTDSALYYAKQALDLSIKNKQDQAIGLAYKNYGTAFYYKGEKEQATANYKKAVPFFKQARDWENMANIEHNLGLLYQKQGFVNESKHHYLSSIEIKKTQQLTEELPSTYNGIAVLYQDISQFDSASYYLKEALKLTEKTDTQSLAYIYNSVGRNYIYQSLHDSALKYYNLSFELKKAQEDSMSIALAIENIGQVFSYQNKYDTAISCYYMALTIYDKYDDKAAKAKIYNNIGGLYLNLRDTTKSEEFYMKSLNLYHKTKNDVGKALVYNNLANVFEDKKNYNKAKQYYLKAMQVLEKVDRPRELANIYGNLSNISKIHKEYDNAIHYLNKSNRICLEHNLLNIYYNNSFNLANIYKELNKNDEALKKLTYINIEEPNKHIEPDTYIKSLELLSNIYSQMGRYKDAYLYSDEYITLYKQQLNKQLFEEVARINTIYETDKIEKENEIFRKQARIDKLNSEKQAKEIENNQKFLFYSLATLVLSLLGVFLLIKLNSSRKKHNNKLIQKNKIISDQNHEIELQLEELAHQKKIVEHQKESITDSINYAKRFQTAIIPSDQQIRQIFSKSFVLYMPRDIVSGDFYYIAKKDQYKYFLAGDCTGHGVPGAFLSIIGHNGLSGAINKFKLTDLSDIMQFLNQYIFDILHQNQEMSIRDGIDLTIVRIDEANKLIDYAGAYNPLLLARNEEITVHKTDKCSIGTKIDFTYQTHQIKYTDGDTIYMFSDGYPDQFGGERGKKFMKKRFYQTLSEITHKPCDEQKTILKDTINNWMKKEKQIDDILVVGISL